MLPQLLVDSKYIFHLDHYSRKSNYNIFYCNFMAHCQAPAFSLQRQIAKYLETVIWKLRKGDDEIFVFHLFRNMQTGCILSFEVQKVPLEKLIHFHFRGVIWVSSIITIQKKIRWFCRSFLTILSSDLFLIQVMKRLTFLKCQINGNNFDTLQDTMCVPLFARAHTHIISFITKYRNNFLFWMPKAQTETTGREWVAKIA